MINLIILNHGQFGEEVIKSAELIVGKIDNIWAFSLLKYMSIEELARQVEERIIGLKGETIILTDMFGGTPNNVAMMMQLKFKCFVICGINLPLLLEMVIARDTTDKPADMIISDAVHTAKQAIFNVIDNRDFDNEF